ncbi:putative peptidoglycan muropeptide transporter SLC46 [Lycorma delicatula]|uniref:putative peptidoglycan muropeptide transporter SLC46 n=1 Tax=Lycorma delicatula TaxID=130591 RepID=UPI003F5142D7
MVLKKLPFNENVEPTVIYNSKKGDISVAKGRQDNTAVIKYRPDIMKLAFPELIALLFQFSIGISSGVITNVWLKSYCLLEPNITEYNCSGIIPTEIENDVQPAVSRMIFIKTCIESLLPGLAILFIGPWSDIQGRRPLLLLSIGGFVVSFTMWTVLSTHTHLNPWYFLFTSIPVGLTGGFVTFYLSTVCCISDITPIHKRSFKMALFEAGCMAGTFTSQLLTAKVSAGPYGFPITFSISAITLFVTLLYVYFFFPETVLYVEPLDNNGFVFDVFKTFFKKRPNYTRALMYLVIIANTAFITIIFGEGSVFYLNTQKRFGWQLQEYSEFSSYSVVIAGMTLYFGTFLMSSVLRISDLTALLLVSLTRICSSLIYTFAASGKLLYVGISVGCLSTLITPLYRSQISKLVPLHELGKVMSFVMFTEAMVPISATFLYTSVYSLTIETYPAAVFLVSTGLSVICSLCILLAFVIHYFCPSQDFSQLEKIIEDESRTNET